MPCWSSTFGCVAQSLQAMQWVRFVVGATSDGNVASNPAISLVKMSGSVSGVKSAQPVLTCIPRSNPWFSHAVAVASLGSADVYRYMLERMQSQLATEQPGVLAATSAWKRASTFALPWLSEVMTTTALSLRGKYQKRGSGLRSRFTWRIRFASRRCCSSACGIATLSRFTQSGCGSNEAAP